ncbi:NAD(P)-dependent oxidoreductase [Bacillus sp. DJP31]|uniref:NAD(P)-dependent oxidoreductase n=1 Tax=Bacillus sp. DJP31 TaxID=3409789 RepID=UPI003BB4BD75
MKVVIFGASGRSGIPLVEQALERGHDVTAFVRTKSKLANTQPKLTIVEGDVLNSEDVERAIIGQDVVLSVIGHTKQGPKDLLSKATQNILKAMNNLGVKRIISLTGAGVKVPKDVKQGFVSRFFETLLKLFEKELWMDSVKQKDLIKESTVDWTIVRGPRLLVGEKTENYQTGYFKFNKPMINRADVAHFILDEIEKNQFVREYPLIGMK